MPNSTAPEHLTEESPTGSVPAKDMETHWGTDQMGAPTCHKGRRQECPAPECGPDRCPRCDGTRIEPGSEDYDYAVHRYNPYTGEPCSACQETV